MNDKANWSHLVVAVGGALAGSWLARRQLQEAKKSRAEVDDPVGAAEAYEEIGELLDDWEPGGRLVNWAGQRLPSDAEIHAFNWNQFGHGLQSKNRACLPSSG